MTAAKAPPSAASPQADRLPAPPRPLLGMYALVFTVLCCVAACAGQITYQGRPDGRNRGEMGERQ